MSPASRLGQRIELLSERDESERIIVRTHFCESLMLINVLMGCMLDDAMKEAEWRTHFFKINPAWSTELTVSCTITLLSDMFTLREGSDADGISVKLTLSSVDHAVIQGPVTYDFGARTSFT